MFICSITKQPTSKPVLSNLSNAIFDESALLTYIDVHGKDPLTNQPMSENDIITIKQSLPLNDIANSTTTSIPSLLTTFQNAWDATAIELFQLRKDLDQCRKELSLALFRCDAAERVAGRERAQREELERVVAELGGALGKGVIIENINENDTANNDQDAIENKIENENKEVENFANLLTNENVKLFKEHKERNKQLKNESVLYDFKLGDKISDINTDIIKCDSFNDKFILTTESSVVVIANNKVDITYDTIPSVGFWMAGNSWSVTKTVKKRKGRQIKKQKTNPEYDFGLINLNSKEEYDIPLEGDIVDVFGHPTLPLFVMLQKSNMYLLKVDQEVEILYNNQIDGNITCGGLHPDGLLAARAIEESVEIVDLATQEVKLTITGVGSCHSLKFANNGYSIILSYDNEVAVYDLRKDEFNIHLSLKEKPAYFNLDIDSHSKFITINDQFSKLENKIWSPLETLKLDQCDSIKTVKFGEKNRCLIISELGVFSSVI